MGKDFKGRNVLIVILFAIFIAVIAIGHALPLMELKLDKLVLQYTSLGMELVGLIGVVFTIWFYNRGYK